MTQITKPGGRYDHEGLSRYLLATVTIRSDSYKSRFFSAAVPPRFYDAAPPQGSSTRTSAASRSWRSTASASASPRPSSGAPTPILPSEALFLVFRFFLDAKRPPPQGPGGPGPFNFRLTAQGDRAICQPHPSPIGSRASLQCRTTPSLIFLGAGGGGSMVGGCVSATP